MLPMLYIFPILGKIDRPVERVDRVFYGLRNHRDGA